MTSTVPLLFIEEVCSENSGLLYSTKQTEQPDLHLLCLQRCKKIYGRNTCSNMWFSYDTEADESCMYCMGHVTMSYNDTVQYLFTGLLYIRYIDKDMK